ncbi:hypothetical protein JGI22_00345 [Candidatus Kryptobacter tengchongensis]|nr:hypothetical protein JGI22_00345 [Candidatus Kryptobacter tengchongensis]
MKVARSALFNDDFISIAAIFESLIIKSISTWSGLPNTNPSANDIIGTLSSSYVAQNVYEMKIYGTEGVLKCYLNKIELQKTTEINPSVYFFDEDIESYIEELCEFAECIINRRKPEVDAEIGLKNLKVIEAMIESNITKKVVKI